MYKSIVKKHARISDMLMYILIYASAGLAMMILAGIIAYVFFKGIGTVTPSFIFGVTSVLKGTVGILGNIVNTLYIIVITVLISAPIGIGAAVYLNEYAKNEHLVKIIEFTTETLAGIPSIIFGLFGYVFFGGTLGLGYSVLTGALTLSIMVLPLITRNTQEALKTVPAGYRSGALGMGATKWHMIRTILLPSAMPGIISGIILSVGRIVGESAALLFTAGSGFLLPKSFFKKIFQPGGTLTIQLYLSMQKGEYKAAFGIACVLLVIVLAINILTGYLAEKFDVNREKR